MSCFADINVSQGSVATYARCGCIFYTHITINLPRNLLVKFFDRLGFDRIMVMSLWPTFSAYPVYCDEMLFVYLFAVLYCATLWCNK